MNVVMNGLQKRHISIPVMIHKPFIFNVLYLRLRLPKPTPYQAALRPVRTAGLLEHTL
jgi:hypothetical protein